MSRNELRRGFGLSVAALGLVLAQGASGQSVAPGSVTVSGDIPGVTTGTDVPDWVKKLALDPESSAVKKYAAQQKVRVASEKQMRKIRAAHFGQIHNQSIRQEGILQLREFTDPALFSSMVELFKKEGVDVRTAIMDTFKDSKSSEGDTCLTWMGVFDDDAEVRAGAINRLRERIKQEGEVPSTVKLVCYEGIRSGKTTAMASSAQLVNSLNIIDAIPWLIAGQLQGAPAGGAASGAGVGNERTGALAWIMVGTQIAFVSDLTPVVGPNAVAFDPQLSVVTEGVLLRILDAVVYSYNVDLNNQLVDMTSRLTGQSTRGLGWNLPAWREYYANEFPRLLAEKKAKDAEEAAAAKSQVSTTSQSSSPL
jgi:hypothetical protein